MQIQLPQIWFEQNVYTHGCMYVCMYVYIGTQIEDK